MKQKISNSLLRDYIQQYPTPASVADKHAELVETVRKTDIPYPTRVQMPAQSDMALNYMRIKAKRQLIKAPFVDNFALLFGKMHIRHLRQIYIVFNWSMKELGTDGRMKIIVKGAHEELYVSSITGIELISTNTPKKLMAMVLLIAISLAFQRPFIVLHGFLQFVPDSSLFLEYLRKISRYIQVICIDPENATKMMVTPQQPAEQGHSAENISSIH